MTGNSINAFLQIAEKGSIAKAARENYISPQSFWKYVSNLEKELQMKLFTRNGRTLKLSPAGEIWYEYFKNSKDNKENLISRLRADAERSSGEKILRVGVESNVWMCPEITGAIQAYNADHGCRRMEIRIATAPVLADLLDLGEIDAAITQSYPEPSRPYDEEELRKGEFLILAAKNHPLILKNAPIEEFIEYEFLIGLDGNGFSPLEARVLFVSRFRRALGAPPRVKVLRNTATALSEVQLGNGLMLINSFDQCAISPFFAKRGTGGESSLVYRRQEADKSTEKLLELLKAAYETKEAIT